MKVLSLVFIKVETRSELGQDQKAEKTIVVCDGLTVMGLAGGCFVGIEERVMHHHGGSAKVEQFLRQFVC